MDWLVGIIEHTIVPQAVDDESIGELVALMLGETPRIGPLLLRALVNQDMYLAGGILLIYSFLTVVGTLLSDVLLALVDPRIRVEG